MQRIRKIEKGFGQHTKTIRKINKTIRRTIMVNIMVVEDEKPISNLIALSLKKAGYHSECAYDGLEAIDMLEKNYPDFDLTRYHAARG